MIIKDKLKGSIYDCIKIEYDKSKKDIHKDNKEKNTMWKTKKDMENKKQ